MDFIGPITRSAWLGFGVLFLTTSASAQERVIDAHLGYVRSLAFSPDGQTLASRGRDGEVTLWDVATGARIRTFEATQKGNGLAFSADGKTLAVSNEIWNAAAGKRILELAQKPTDRVAFSPDGALLATAEEGRIWRVTTGVTVATIPASGLVAFSRDGTLLTTRNSELKLWDIASLSRSGSPNRTSLAKARGKAAESKQKPTNNAPQKLEPSDTVKFEVVGSVRPLAFSPDGKILAATVGPVTVLIDTARGKPLLEFSEKDAVRASACAFSSDAKLIAIAGLRNDYGAIDVRDVSTGDLVATLDGGRSFRNIVVSLTFSPDGRKLATGDYYAGKVKLWDVQTLAKPR